MCPINETSTPPADVLIFVDFQSGRWSTSPTPESIVPTMHGLIDFITGGTGCSSDAASDVLEVLMEVFGIPDIEALQSRPPPSVKG